MRLVWCGCGRRLASPFLGGRATAVGRGTRGVRGGGCGGVGWRRSLDGATPGPGTMPFLRPVSHSLWPRTPAHIHRVAMRPVRCGCGGHRASPVLRGRATAGGKIAPGSLRRLSTAGRPRPPERLWAWLCGGAFDEPRAELLRSTRSAPSRTRRQTPHHVCRVARGSPPLGAQANGGST
jgi:hypothetical protein